MSKNIFSLLFFIGWLLGSCATVNNSNKQYETPETSSSPIDTVFIDYKPTPPNTNYHVFKASKDGKSGWMNIDGDWIISPEYDDDFTRGWSEGINVCRKEGKYGAINYKGEVVIPFKYSSPPSDCSYGLILVEDSLNHVAYFSKNGIRMTDFKKHQPEFRNGFAVIRTNRKEFARYPRIDLENSNRATQLHKGDFIVINTQFDTLLEFKNVPFLLEFGTLNDNRRTFFLYPYLGLHADVGISYGRYGYLDGEGKIAIDPKFRALDVFIPLAQGYVRDPDCPFNSNLSMVRELEEYYFIDTLGNKVFELKTNRKRIYNVSHFNNYGVAGYRTFGEKPNSSMIHLIDTEGNILHEAYESDAPMSYVAGNIGHQPHNNLVPIYDKLKAVHQIYTPAFKPFASFPLKDSSETITYQYRGLFDTKLDNQFILTQYKSTKNSHGYPGSHQRLIDSNGDAKSSWFSHKNILSSLHNNFSFVDSTTMTTTLYDFSKNVLFKCDSCFFHYGYKLSSNGIYKVQLSNGNWAYVNYQGKVLSALFDSFEEKVYNLTEQVETFNTDDYNTISAKENEFIKLFNESIMYKRIIK